MDRQNPHAILARADRESLLLTAAEMAQAIRVADVMQPMAGMVMLQVIETVDRQPFNLGEVLITEAEVQVGEVFVRGYAMGDDPEGARARAIIMGALTCGNSELQAWAARFLAEQEAQIEAAIAAEEHLVQRTLVKFETMEAQDAQHKGSKL